MFPFFTGFLLPCFARKELENPFFYDQIRNTRYRPFPMENNAIKQEPFSLSE